MNSDIRNNNSNRPKICHVLSCDIKFIPGIIALYQEINPEKNIFIEYSERSVLSNEYKQSNMIEWHKIGDTEFLSLENIKKSNITHVFFHFYWPETSSLLKQVYKYCTTVFCSGGRDLVLGQPYYCIENKTKKILYPTKIKRFIFELRHYKNEIFRFLGLHRHLRSFRYFDYCKPCLYDDYAYIKKRYPFFLKAKYVEGTFGLSKRDTYVFDNKHGENNIFLGHSAYPYGNHIEALDHLFKIKTNKKIYMPLSYGKPIYAKEVEKYANKLFGEQAVCIKEFIPYIEYIKILEKCQYFYFRIHCQCALGNVNLALSQGCNVYIPADSPVYKFYKQKGAIIFTPNELENHLINNKQLTEDEKVNNQKVVIDYFGKKAAIEHAKHLCKTIGFDL